MLLFSDQIGEKLSEFLTSKGAASFSSSSTPSSSEENNLTKTAATLEMSLKNSAEILKQLSSVGNIEDLHKLERQMQESMQLIEKLKSTATAASRQKQQRQHQTQQMHMQHSPPPPSMHNNTSSGSFTNGNAVAAVKLRLINSMPASMNLVSQSPQTQQNSQHISIELKKDGKIAIITYCIHYIQTTILF